jgi:hypothetical protein
MYETLDFECFNPNNVTQTYSIFVKHSKNIFLGMPKVEAGQFLHY